MAVHQDFCAVLARHLTGEAEYHPPGEWFLGLLNGSFVECAVSGYARVSCAGIWEVSGQGVWNAADFTLPTVGENYTASYWALFQAETGGNWCIAGICGSFSAASLLFQAGRTYILPAHGLAVSITNGHATADVCGKLCQHIFGLFAFPAGPGTLQFYTGTFSAGSDLSGSTGSGTLTKATGVAANPALDFDPVGDPRTFPVTATRFGAVQLGADADAGVLTSPPPAGLRAYGQEVGGYPVCASVTRVPSIHERVGFRMVGAKGADLHAATRNTTGFGHVVQGS